MRSPLKKALKALAEARWSQDTPFGTLAEARLAAMTAKARLLAGSGSMRALCDASLNAERAHLWVGSCSTGRVLLESTVRALCGVALLEGSR